MDPPSTERPLSSASSGRSASQRAKPHDIRDGVEACAPPHPIVLSLLFFVSETHCGVRVYLTRRPHNRSFDHLMGFLKRVNPEIQGLVGNETNPYDPKDLSLGYVTVSDDSGYVTEPDPGVRPRRGGVRWRLARTWGGLARRLTVCTLLALARTWCGASVRRRLTLCTLPPVPIPVFFCFHSTRSTT